MKVSEVVPTIILSVSILSKGILLEVSSPVNISSRNRISYCARGTDKCAARKIQTANAESLASLRKSWYFSGCVLSRIRSI